jgi:hypothetical protein
MGGNLLIMQPMRVYHLSTLSPDDIPGHRFGNLPLDLQCGARAKSTGKPCRAIKVKGKTRCRVHGVWTGNQTHWAKLQRQRRALLGDGDEQEQKSNVP